MPQRARPPPWNNIKLFVSPEPPPPARALSLFVTSLKTFTFKSFSRCPLHYSTTKTSLCGFLGNLKDPFVPPPAHFYPFPLPKPLPAPRICTTASYSRCRCESRNSSHEIPSIILLRHLHFDRVMKVRASEMNYSTSRLAFF